MATPFPPPPLTLDVNKLLTWVNKVKTWAEATVERIRALDEAEVAVQPGDFTITTENVIEYTGPGGNTFTLPSASTIPGRRSRPRYLLNHGLGAVTLAAQGGETINGAATYDVGTQGLAILVSNGALAWRLIMLGTDSTGNSIEVGSGAQAGDESVAIGKGAIANRRSVVIGALSKMLGAVGIGDNTLIGYAVQCGTALTQSVLIGDGVRTDDNASAVIVIGGGSARADLTSTASSTNSSVALGYGVKSKHENVVLLGGGRSLESTQAGQFIVALKDVNALQVVNNPASGETGMYLVCDVGGGIVVKKVTLAASVGGQRALQVAG